MALAIWPTYNLKVKIGRDIMNVANPLHNTHIMKLTTESILERIFTNEMKVAYHSINLQVFIFTTESTQEINLTNVAL